MTAGATWSVVTMTRNTPEDFKRFVSWYLDLGAQHIVLYFHDPDDPNIQLVDGHSQITCERMTKAFLQQQGAEWEEHNKLQDCIGMLAYPDLTTDWVLRTDIDELVLYQSDQSLGQLLAAQPEDVLTVVVEPAEYLKPEHESTRFRFRTTMDDETLDLIYGAEADLIRSRKGLIGHRMGKSISRVGVPDLEIHTHAGRYANRRIPMKRPRLSRTTNIRLLHFNAVSADVWSRTINYRIQYSSFDPKLAQRLRELRKAGDAGQSEIVRLYESITRFDDARFDRLQNAGAGFAVDLDFTGLIARYFPDGKLAELQGRR